MVLPEYTPSRGPSNSNDSLNRVVETLDSMVAIGIFKSRSEAAAALIEGAISEREDLFDDIRKQASSLSKQQDEAMKEA